MDHDQGPTSRCFGPCGWTHSYLDNTYATISHELAEAITDPITTGVKYPGAWNHVSEGEIADYCNQLHGTVLGPDSNIYTIQQLWSNANKTCLSPSVSVNPTTTTATVSPTPSPKLSRTCHDLCQVGDPVGIFCNACTLDVVYNDNYCGTTGWDMVCLQKAEAWCAVARKKSTACYISLTIKYNCPFVVKSHINYVPLTNNVFDNKYNIVNKYNVNNDINNIDKYQFNFNNNINKYKYKFNDINNQNYHYLFINNNQNHHIFNNNQKHNNVNNYDQQHSHHRKILLQSHDRLLMRLMLFELF
ncbi:hypothetical protein HDU76_003061 [Blyttiomyces sp. JEL0837]|nr:hypothetical protein HDU76_003061 [Blyttiomyces sp. JEL0837]